MAVGWTQRDWRALALIGLAFALMLVATWGRWTQPIIDHGREMNLPARLVAGDELYLDVQFLYGPFAPHFNALLYRIFGIHLGVLHTAGALCALLILALVYRLARYFAGAPEAAAAAGLVLVFCAVKATANYISPYAYAALYGLLFSLAALVCALEYTRGGRSRWIAAAGALTGLSLVSKWELALAALVASAAALILLSLSARRLLWREALLYALPAAAITLVAYGYTLSRVPWRVLLEENHILFSSMPPQLVYFNQQISGLAAWPQSLWYTLSGVGMLFLTAGAVVIIGALIGGALIGRRTDKEWRHVAGRGLRLALLGGLWWGALVAIFGVRASATLLTGMPVVLPVVILALSTRIYLCWRRGEQVPWERGALLLLALFADVSILRAILNVKTTGPYVPFFIPAVIVFSALLLLRYLPERVAREPEMQRSVRRGAMILICLLIVGVAVGSVLRLRRDNTFEVRTIRGSFLTEPQIGAPLQAAIEYARSETSPDDAVLSIPQATSINFMAARRYPFHEEIIHPGFLSDERAIARLRARPARLVFVVNLLTPEFRDRVFGSDYNPGLMRWIEEHYTLAARFDTEASRNAKLGDDQFFILAYRLKEPHKARQTAQQTARQTAQAGR